MSYGFFADYYDFFTENINYKAYAARVTRIANDLKIHGGRAMDLGCGTGSLSVELARSGFSVTGVDLSQAMINKANEKLQSSPNNAIAAKCRFVSHDITRLSDILKDNSCMLAVSSMDVLNHLPDFKSVEMVFSGVSRALKRGGAFVFDMNTIYKHRHVLADNCFVFDSDTAYMGWQNDYLEDDNSVQITLDFFVPEENGCYKRHTESFTERAYPAKSIMEALERNGMKLIALYDGLSTKSPRKTTQRVMYVSIKK